MEDLIREFLSTGRGRGSGYGTGYGTGFGNGFGNGDGFGDGRGRGSGYGTGNGSGTGYDYGKGRGNGNGFGNGCGSGFGDGCGSGLVRGLGRGNDCGSGAGPGYDYSKGIKSINGEKVYRVDGVQTIIRHVRGNVAKGAILCSDLSLTPCYIAKQDNSFAHGKTLHEAVQALRGKLLRTVPVEERISAFVAEHPTLDGLHGNRDFYDWHHLLTGSCELGRMTFAQNRGIDLEGKMTVREFLELTKNDFGGGVIRKTMERYGHGEE